MEGQLSFMMKLNCMDEPSISRQIFRDHHWINSYSKHIWACALLVMNNRIIVCNHDNWLIERKFSKSHHRAILAKLLQCDIWCMFVILSDTGNPAYGRASRSHVKKGASLFVSMLFKSNNRNDKNNWLLLIGNSFPSQVDKKSNIIRALE